MAAAIEQNNDKDGIIWPRAIAPFEVVVVPVNAKVPEQLELAEQIYSELKAAGVDVFIRGLNRPSGWERHKNFRRGVRLVGVIVGGLSYLRARQSVCH